MFERADDHEREPARAAAPRGRAVPVRRRTTPSASPVVGLAGGPLDAATSSRIAASTGRPLPEPVRERMEGSFGADFGAVRIHEGPEAAELSAIAFTRGTDIHFAPGQFRPASSGGQELLAHELAHVVQQTGTVGRRTAGRIRRALVVGAADDPAELEADRIAHRVMAGESFDPGRGVACDEEIHRRIDRGAVTANLGAAMTAKDGYQRFAADVFQVWNAIKGRIPALLAPAYVPAVTNLMGPVNTAVNTKPFSAAALAVAAGQVIDLVNDVENVVELADRNVADLANAVQVQPATAGLQIRHDAAHEALGSLLPGPRAASLAAAQAAVQNAALAGVYDPVATRRLMVAYLELLETEEAAVAPANLMKVGTEMTFTNDALTTLNVLDKNDVFATAMTLIKAWMKKIEAATVRFGDGKELRTPAPTMVPLTSAGDRAQKGKPDTNDEKSPKYIYALPSGATWWWQINIDYQCLELQTQPTTPAMLSGDAGTDDTLAIRAILDTHVYKQATGSGGLNLRTDRVIGGGHITLDRTTTFGDNARWLRNFLVIYANEGASWIAEDPDWFNAPHVTELTTAGRKAFKDLIATFDRTPNATADDLARDLQINVYKKEYLPPPQTAEQRAANSKRLDQAPHYQAINVENTRQQVTTERRLEMRRFDAQTNVTDLIDNLTKIGGLVERARQPGRVVLNKID